MDQLEVSGKLRIPLSEIDMKAVRAQGPGGQNVNKVATAIQLRFDVRNSPSLPRNIRDRLLASGDRRLSSEGVLVIKAQESRSQEQNRRAALDRLCELLEEAGRDQKPRLPTMPGKSVKRRRLDEKTRRGDLKKLRGKPRHD